MDNYKISIIIPVYEEEKQLYQNINIIHSILLNHRIEHYFILVDDGSKDNTWDEILSLSHDIKCVKGLKLSRNFGKESAICAGLDASDGDASIVMDADLQHPPGIIPDMVSLWKNNNFDVVEAVKTSRGKESPINKIGAHIFYNLLKKLSGIDLNNASDFKLIDVKVISSWSLMNERNTFFRAMSTWVGFKRAKIPFEVVERKEGNSKWSVFRLTKLAISAITSFSSLPLQIVTLLGIGFLIGSIILGIQTLYMKFNQMAVSGFTTVILLQLIIGSALMISLGIIGTYIARIFEEVKQRPRYIISKKTDFKQ